MEKTTCAGMTDGAGTRHQSEETELEWQKVGDQDKCKQHEQEKRVKSCLWDSHRRI